MGDRHYSKSYHYRSSRSSRIYDDESYNSSKRSRRDVSLYSTSSSAARRQLAKYRCEMCDVYVDSRAIYETHLSSQNHLRRTRPTRRFKCDICQVEVSSAETLQSHFQGARHLKQMSRSRSRSNRWHVKDDPEQLEKARTENKELKREIKYLQDKIKILSDFDKFCKMNHTTDDAGEDNNAA